MKSSSQPTHQYEQKSESDLSHNGSEEMKHSENQDVELTDIQGNSNNLNQVDNEAAKEDTTKFNNSSKSEVPFTMVQGESGEEQEQQVQSEEIDVDYPKLFEKYQDRFNIAYANSQKLFNIEQVQRETLNYYQRRNNAIIDLLNEINFEDGDKSDKSMNDEVLGESDRSRLENIVEMNPNLKNILEPLINNFSRAKISRDRRLNLLVHESISELLNDDLKSFEINPQDIDSWCRRHYPNLAISKFKPINFKSDFPEHESINSNGTNNSNGPISSATTRSLPKRKRKLDVEVEESTKKSK